jgi:selenophosphate synthetase-related protein
VEEGIKGWWSNRPSMEAMNEKVLEKLKAKHGDAVLKANEFRGAYRRSLPIYERG